MLGDSVPLSRNDCQEYLVGGVHRGRILQDEMDLRRL